MANLSLLENVRRQEDYTSAASVVSLRLGSGCHGIAIVTVFNFLTMMLWTDLATLHIIEMDSLCIRFKYNNSLMYNYVEAQKIKFMYSNYSKIRMQFRQLRLLEARSAGLDLPSYTDTMVSSDIIFSWDI